MSEFSPQNAVIWIEMPVTDLAKSKAFYGAVLQNEMIDQEAGPAPTVVFHRSEKSGIGGHLYVGKPGTPGVGSTIHLAAPLPLEDSLARVKAAGGQVVSGIVKIPNGSFAYCLDPDGNSFGLFV
jgi:uncharacterized protein